MTSMRRRVCNSWMPPAALMENQAGWEETSSFVSCSVSWALSTRKSCTTVMSCCSCRSPSARRRSSRAERVPVEARPSDQSIRPA
ncbi:MAG: hypothetical protein NTV86_16660 [Planctomycetota bacterium]|nr:hypothetical protein [Planctomycetota bacterium]